MTNPSILIQQFRQRLLGEIMELDATLLQPVDIQKTLVQMKVVKNTLVHLTNLLRIEDDIQRREGGF